MSNGFEMLLLNLIVKFKQIQQNHIEVQTELNWTEPNRTEQNRTEQNRTEQNRTEQNSLAEEPTSAAGQLNALADVGEAQKLFPLSASSFPFTSATCGPREKV